MYKKIDNYLIKFGVKNKQDRVDIIHDVLLNPKAKDREFFYAKNRALNLFKKEKRERERAISLNSFLNADGTTLEETLQEDLSNLKKARLLKRQQDLIYQLTLESDERTLAIVEAFLRKDKPSMTNVAKDLSLNHNQVNRSLKRLARNYDEDKNGLLDNYLYL